LDIIEEGLKDYPTETLDVQQEIPFERDIQIQGLTYTYPDGESVFENFDACIRKGEYVGFQGYSGVWKSTLSIYCWACWNRMKEKSVSMESC
jgi:ABC-type multidrug transport system fused ATPase/permease subunit